jgi:ribosome-associated translation inhibitor RaiA
VIPNGLAAEALVQPERHAVEAFRARLSRRTVVSKVARWHPDKRWLFAIDTMGAMQRLGWRPLLIARGGVEAHGAEVLATAAAAGLHVVERPLPQQGVRGLLQALEGLESVDVVSLTSPLDADSSRLLFHGSDAVLANSGHEPFGLVGLETMAVGGVACTGCSGEDYAIPGHNALVLETLEAREFIGLFGDLRANRAHERALRQAGRLTAKQYTWSWIAQRLLLPRLRLAIADSCPETGGPGMLFGKGAGMRYHIQGQHTSIAPPLLAWIAERLEDLNTPSEDVRHADVTLVKHHEWRRSRYEARVELTLAAKCLQAVHVGKTPYDAMVAALKAVEQKLRACRGLDGVTGSPPYSV